MPLDEFRMLDYLNGLDANRVKQGDRISSSNIEDGGDDTADVCATFHDAFHILSFTQTFDGGLDRLAMRFDKVKLLLVPGNLLGIAMGIDLHQIVLSNKAQNDDRVCFIVQGLKVVAKEIGTEEGRSKNFGDVMH
jgi:hypothetical protein